MSSTIGKNIKRARELAGFRTQGSFAKAMEVPQPQVSDWENDRYGELKTSTLIDISKKLKVSINELLVGIDEGYDKLFQMSEEKSMLPSHGGVDVPSFTDRPRLLELEDRVKAYEIALDQMRDLAGRLLEIRIAARRAEDATVTRRRPSRRRDNRRTG